MNKTLLFILGIAGLYFYSKEKVINIIDNRFSIIRANLRSFDISFPTSILPVLKANLELDIENDTPITIPVTRMNTEIVLRNNVIGTAVFNDPIKLLPNGISTIDIKMNVTLQNVASEVIDILTGGTIPRGLIIRGTALSNGVVIPFEKPILQF